MRTWSHGITMGLGLGLALAVACKDDGGTGPVPENDAPQRIAAAVCDAWAACKCSDYDAFAMRFDSDADCRTEIAEGVQDRLDDGNNAMLTYDASCVGKTIDEIGALECKTIVELVIDEEVAALTRDVQACKWFYGEQAAGEPCEATPSGDDNCAADLQCNGQVCAIRNGAEGDDCTPLMQGQCDLGLACVDVDGDGQNTCTSLPVAGETCLGTLDLCALEAYCDQADKKCHELPAAGSACAPFDSVLQSKCELGALCNASDVCELAPAAGEACPDKVCALGSSCVMDTCAKDAPAICFQFGSSD